MRLTVTVFVGALLAAAPAEAQDSQGTAAPGAVHVHADPASPSMRTRDSSGTAWLPDVTPTHGFHRQLSGWHLMLHGNLFLQYLHESGEEHRRGRQAGSINWFMAMASRQAARGTLEARAMVSLEPWTIRGCGYPNLTATGEVCRGDTIHDRQHPHDLFMELAARYERPLTPSIGWFVYGGPAGEPALGPPAFPHRPSAFPNPIAPTSHHWFDSTHVAFGVVTAGIAAERWKVDASIFNGREPDEQRWDIDAAILDSFAARISFAPTPNLTMQVSAGHLEEAEAGIGSQPAADANRATASAIFHTPIGTGGLLAMTAAYGVNSSREAVPEGVLHQTTHAGLLEVSASFRERHTLFGRAELVGKPAHDLHIHERITEVFPIGRLQGGYVRYLGARSGLTPGLGATISAALVPAELAPRYGGRVAPGFGVFLTLRSASS